MFIEPAVSSMYGFGLTVRNVNEALPLGLSLLKQHGRPVVSRGKETLEVPGPVTTIYRNPYERVLFEPARDANPFFHFFEALWILAGSDKVDLPALFLPRIKEYSDDGSRLHGAYGYRLRYACGLDQIERAVQLLQEQPDTRQCVLSIWVPRADLGARSKDIPCNDTITFKLRDGRLNMTVFCRSNDVVWGAYGANAVQFSVLQEYIATRVGCEIGFYTQVSDSYHVYTDLPLWQSYVNGDVHLTGHTHCPYRGAPEPPWRPLFLDSTDALQAVADASLLCELTEAEIKDHRLLKAVWRSNLFKTVASPMLSAHYLYRMGRLHDAVRAARDIDAPDWSAACVFWIKRRIERRGDAT